MRLLRSLVVSTPHLRWVQVYAPTNTGLPFDGLRMALDQRSLAMTFGAVVKSRPHAGVAKW